MDSPVAKQMKSNNLKQKKYKKICCPKCKSNYVKKNGVRQTQNRGLIQRYKCKNCSYRFVQDLGFFRMRNNPKKITCAIDLFYKGVSTRQIQSHLQAFYPANSSWVTIWSWVVKYSNLIHNKVKNIKLRIGQEIQIDEMEYGNRKREQTKTYWFIDCIDTTTRYMISSELVNNREQKEIKKILNSAKFKTENQIKIVTTDGYLAYKNAIKKVFGYYNLKNKSIRHNQVNASQGEGFNHKIERLHNSIRHRTKTFRGFKNLQSANAIMKGYEIYYNFIRKNLAIGCCPYELATDIKLKSPNKWLELIELSQENGN